MAGLPDVAEQLRLHYEEVARKRREYEEEQRRRQEERQRAEVRAARFRFIDEQARLWERRRRIVFYLTDVRRRLEEADWTPQQRATAVEWVAWADDYLARCDPTALLFLNPILKPDGGLFSHYRYTPGYNERDVWMALYEREVGSYY